MAKGRGEPVITTTDSTARRSFVPDSQIFERFIGAVLAGLFGMLAAGKAIGGKASKL